jgi:cell wall assembly regulator SMI1
MRLSGGLIKSNMSPKQIIEKAFGQELTTEDGDPITLELLPGLTDDEILAFEKTLPFPLPEDIRELLRFTRGFEGGYADYVDFTGGSMLLEYEWIFPLGIPIAKDGYGNFWVVDMAQSETSWGPVYFAGHDPAVVLMQGPSLMHFLEELFKLSVEPYEGIANDVHDDNVFDVWEKNPGVLSWADCAAGQDAELRAFAETLDPVCQIIDLRNAPIGMGFSWGRYGGPESVHRHGNFPIFAYTPKKSIFNRLFNRNK